MRLSMSNNIEITPFKVGWIQLLVGAAAIGGYIVTLSTSTEAIKNLNETMAEVNNTLTAMKVEDKHDKMDIEMLKKNDAKQNEDIIELQIVTGIRK